MGTELAAPGARPDISSYLDGATSRPTGPAPPDRGAPVFVGVVWALLLLSCLAYVEHFGSSLPHLDDWALVPVLSGRQPLTLSWLWTPYAEHRVVLPRLVNVSLLWVADCDFRALLAFNVLLMGATTFILVRAARQLRGWTSYADAFLPLLLMNVSLDNLLLGSASNLDPLLAGIILALIVRTQQPLTLGAAAGTAACVAGLVLCGALGLAMAPALLAWLGYSGVTRWRSGGTHRRRDGLLTLAMALAVALLVPFYLWGIKPMEGMPPNPGVEATLETALQVLALGFGRAASTFWPIVGYGVIGLLAASLASLALVWRRRPQERSRAVGILLFLGSLLSMALAIGIGRAGLTDMAGFGGYTTSSVLFLCGVYFAFAIGNEAISRFAQMGLLSVMWVFLAFNTQTGLHYGQYIRKRTQLLEEDIQAGIPPRMLAERHWCYQYPVNQGQDLAEWLRMLRRAHVGPFIQQQPDPDFREVRLALGAAALEKITRDGEILLTSGPDSALAFAQQPRFVYAFRVRFHYEADPGDMMVPAVLWKGGGQQTFTPARAGVAPSYDPNWDWMYPERVRMRSQLFWVDHTVDQIRICPGDAPARFEIAELTLLVPPEE